jgi:hypothetical protein
MATAVRRPPPSVGTQPRGYLATPRRRSGIFLILLGMALGEAIKTIFEWRPVTPGEAGAIAAPVIVALLGIGWARWKSGWWMRFSEAEFGSPAEQAHWRRSRTVQRGASTFPVAVCPREGTSLKSFNVRFLRRWLFKWRSVPTDIIRIAAIRLPEWDAEKQTWARSGQRYNFGVRDDGQDGISVVRYEPKELSAGELVWIEITVEAKIPAELYLSFESKSQQRIRMRLPFSIIASL